MPRAKVRDEDRQRARRACIPCKNSKIRCDANEPCSNCIRKECSSNCQYLSSSINQQEQTSRASKVPRTSYQQKSAGLPQKSDHARQDQEPSNDVAGRHDQQANKDSSDNHAPTTKPSPEFTCSRMLLSSKGEKMYIGKYSSLSLLQFLRQTVSMQIGPSQFSETAAKNIMLEADITPNREININSLDNQYKQALIQCFFQVSCGFLLLYKEDEVYNFLTQSNQTVQKYGLSPDDRAALYLILAIGGQSRGQEPFDIKFAANCFTKARVLAFEGMLCDPSINMVRIFMLLSFYMLGACRRNAAYMYLGIAAKAACALGLHSKSQYPNLLVHERELKVRVWKSLYVLDTLVNSLLGRPGTLPVVQQGKYGQVTGPASQNPLNAAYGACVQIATIMPTVSRNSELDSNFAETFLEKLARWRENAQPEKSQNASGLSSLPDAHLPEQQIGNLHVACIYYYAIILVTRPFLLSHLTYILRLRKTTTKDAGSPSPQTDGKIAKLAQVCTDTAGYLTQSCERVINSGGLKDNMCILKALVFAAGLLLGYSNFVDGKASENEEAFHAAQVVLKKFSRLSPQARHYHEILQDFQNAITKYQQMQHDKRRKSTGKYVKPLFFDSNSSTENVSPATTVGSQQGDMGRKGKHTMATHRNNPYIGSVDFMDITEMNSNDSMSLGTTDMDFDGSMSMPLFWDESFDWSVFSAFPDEVNIGM